ncbi:MAG: winged helix-turn-helix transcriptional regulator [Abditibacteriota bacterium]|nr:winged helix-turn-helix transcriptional regulator [Abditibacteriota bacterium]
MKKKEIVADFIKTLINKGTLRQGDKIPSEPEIMKELNLSRFTVREGINLLRSENIIETIHGSGSYIKNINKTKKYILVISDDICITGNARESYRFLLNEIKNKINDTGYIPYYYIDRQNSDILNEIPQIISESVGVISVHGTERTLDKLNSFNIPIISALYTIAREYSSVMPNYTLIFNLLINTIKKYKLKKILIFSINHTIHRVEKDNFIMYAIDSYFKKYDFVPISFSENLPSAISKFRNKMNGLKYIPDVIIFLDDTIFNNVFPIFGDYDKILKKTKIITHASGYREDYGNKYDICRIEFDLRNMAEESINLLLKKVKGEFVNKQNIYINPVLINEKVFKK